MLKQLSELLCSSLQKGAAGTFALCTTNAAPSSVQSTMWRVSGSSINW